MAFQKHLSACSCHLALLDPLSPSLLPEEEKRKRNGSLKELGRLQTGVLTSPAEPFWPEGKRAAPALTPSGPRLRPARSLL